MKRLCDRGTASRLSHSFPSVRLEDQGLQPLRVLVLPFLKMGIYVIVTVPPNGAGVGDSR